MAGACLVPSARDLGGGGAGQGEAQFTATAHCQQQRRRDCDGDGDGDGDGDWALHKDVDGQRRRGEHDISDGL